ncbi:MAG TPA: TIGR03619 family F420-dependent LLM class oxidoreductase [Tepidiformaceae bacterium]|nr:TIGR03619 family F420-dependent LLM class oxidoreductase [Tepidiformaceae bacterium]
MHVGVKIGPAMDARLADAARAAEDIGFDSVWLSERVAIPLDTAHAYEPMTDPWIGLAFAAAVTSRVQLGTSVAQIALRHPVLMSRELATLDRLSGGRLIVGAGAGWVEEEFTTTGVPFETRGGRLNEAVQVMRHIWTKPGEPWKGRFFDLPRAGIVGPLTPGGPPIFFGAGAMAGIKRAAKYGDGFIGVTRTPGDAGKLAARVRGIRAEMGKTGPFPVYFQAAPPESLAEAEEMRGAFAEGGVDGLILTYAGTPPDSFSGQDEVVRVLREGR